MSNLGGGFCLAASGFLVEQGGGGAPPDLSAYLTQASAATTYLTQANAASTYLTQANATSTYLSIADAATTYAALTHATRHKSGGADAIKLDELAAPTDIATLNATASLHGLLPKLSGNAYDLFLGSGAYGTTLTRDSIATAQTVGLTLQNTTAAALGAQQYSSVFKQSGQGRKTNATAESQEVAFGLQVRPVQGTTVATGAWDILAGIGTGGSPATLTAVAEISSGGAFRASPGLISAPAYSFIGGLTSTGFWFENSALRFAHGGQEVFFASNTGFHPGIINNYPLGSSSGRWSTLWSNRLNVAPVASTSATPTAIELLTGPAHTGLTLAEALMVDWDLDATVTFAAAGGAGPLALQRAAYIRAPAYARTTNALTITESPTLQIDAPTAGTNVTLPSPSALLLNGALALRKLATAPTGVNDSVYMYVDESGGKDRLMVVFGTGAAQEVKLEA